MLVAVRFEDYQHCVSFVIMLSSKVTPSMLYNPILLLELPNYFFNKHAKYLLLAEQLVKLLHAPGGSLLGSHFVNRCKMSFSALWSLPKSILNQEVLRAVVAYSNISLSLCRSINLNTPNFLTSQCAKSITCESKSYICVTARYTDTLLSALTHFLLQAAVFHFKSN